MRHRGAHIPAFIRHRISTGDGCRTGAVDRFFRIDHQHVDIRASIIKYKSYRQQLCRSRSHCIGSRLVAAIQVSGHLIDRNLRSHTVEYLQRVEELLAHIAAGIGNGVVTAYHNGAASVHHLAHVHDKGIGSGTVVGQCHAEGFKFSGGSGSSGQHIDGAAIVGHYSKVARDSR